MSRTYRRKGVEKWQGYVTSELVKLSFGSWIWVKLDYQSEKCKKRIAIFHSDSGDSSWMEPGPSWFRTLTAQVPYRRRAKNEIRKFLLNDEYEVIIEDMPHLVYWS